MTRKKKTFLKWFLNIFGFPKGFCTSRSPCIPTNIRFCIFTVFFNILYTLHSHTVNSGSIQVPGRILSRASSTVHIQTIEGTTGQYTK